LDLQIANKTEKNHYTKFETVQKIVEEEPDEFN